MPRRHLRQIDPRIDLTGYFFDRDSHPKTISSEALFGNPAPLEIEVGSGKGLFLATASGIRPENNFLGIEIADKYARAAAVRLARHVRTNAKMIAGDAQPLVANAVADESLEAIHVYFPDPWWKKKHKKRRVLNDKFLQDCCRTLRIGGRLHFWTDVLEYFQATLEFIGQHVPTLGVPIPEEPSSLQSEGSTHFERRSLRYEIPVYRVYFSKVGGWP
jgi:tRNA (guanine-N7-)-methyltransferase